MLINSIYEFFVTLIFGGTLWRDGQPANFSGIFLVGRNASNGAYVTESMYTIRGVAYTAMDGTARYYSIGNYLSLVATIISVIIILVLCCLFIKKIISLMGKLFSGGTL